MGVVDKHDQTLTCFPTVRKFLKAYNKILFHTMDIVLSSIFIIHSELIKEKFKNKNKHMCLDLANHIPENVTPASYNRTRRMSAGGSSAIQVKKWAHFARHMPATARKHNLAKACKVCASYGK
jgi:hypothetical protein